MRKQSHPVAIFPSENVLTAYSYINVVAVHLNFTFTSWNAFRDRFPSILVSQFNFLGLLV